MTLGRRRFLQTTAAAAAATPLLSSCSSTSVYQHGVASGDPLTDSVILWTRISEQDAAVSVTWEIDTDSGFGNPQTGTLMATPDNDYTVKVDVGGLTAGTTYYYRFEAEGQRSPVGRTRTLPEGSVDRMRIAFVSCSNYPEGFFHAYRGLAERADLDVVLHLGDYIYEYAEGTFGEGEGIERLPDPDNEITTLSDYRRRFAQYRTDEDLQEAHRQHPWIVIWDDHESANDAYADGAENHDEGEGDWETRKANSIQAYYEWMPIREPASGNRQEINRAFEAGDLISLTMLETRLGRDVQPTTELEAVDEDRQLLGEEQEAWLFGRLQNATATWKMVGQQTQLAHLAVPGQEALFFDGWGGYRAARRRFLENIENNGIDNVVVLTGDVHSSFASDLAIDPNPTSTNPTYDGATQAGALAVEFITPSVTSRGLGQAARDLGIDLEANIALVVGLNPHIRFFDVEEQGYVLLDVTQQRVQAEFYFVSNVREPVFDQRVGAVWVMNAGENRLTEGSDPSTPRGDAPPLAR